MVLIRKRKKLESEIWEMRRVSSDSEPSETENEYVREKFHEPEMTEFQMAPSKLFPELKTFVRRKTNPSDQSQQPQAKSDDLNPPASFLSVSESKSDGQSEQASASHTRAKSVSESDCDRHKGKKIVPSKRCAKRRAVYVSESDEDSDRHRGVKIVPSKGCAKRRAVYTSVLDTVSESDSEKGEESDEDSDRHRGVKIAPPKECAKRRAVYISDRMKMFRQAQAEMNPEASLQPHRAYNKSFLTQENCNRYNSYWKKEMVEQRLVELNSYGSLGIKQIVEDNHLLNTVTCVEPYVREIVMEFYANLPSEETNKLVHKVFVRGQMFEFSPKLINSVLDLRGREITRGKETAIDVDLNLIAATLTGGNVKDWEKITPAYLSPPIAALHMICCANWIPTGNTCAALSEDRARLLYMLLNKTPFDFGKLVYDQIIRLGKMAESKFKPVLPALIFKVLNYQRRIQLFKGESFSHLAAPICYHVRLSRGKHVAPPSPSGPKGKTQGRSSKKASLPSLSGPKDKTQGRSSKNVSPPSPSGRKSKTQDRNSKKASLLSHSGPKGKARGRNIENAALHLTPRRKAKLIDKAMAYLEIGNIDRAMAYLEVANGEIDTSSDEEDEEETDDDDGISSKNVSPPSPSGRKSKTQDRNSKKASLLPHSGPKGKARDRNINKNAAFPSTSSRKAKLKTYVDKTMASLQIINEKLEEIDTSSDEEETDDVKRVVKLPKE